MYKEEMAEMSEEFRRLCSRDTFKLNFTTEREHQDCGRLGCDAVSIAEINRDVSKGSPKP